MASTLAKAIEHGDRRVNEAVAEFAATVRLALLRNGDDADAPVTAELVSAAMTDIETAAKRLFGSRKGDLGALGELILGETARTTDMAMVDAMRPVDRALKSDPLVRLFLTRVASNG